VRAWAPTLTLAPTATSSETHEQDTTTWRECAQRTPRNDRWRCSLDAGGRTRGRVLQEGLPPVFGLHADATTTNDDVVDSWIVVMDNERASSDDILRLCDPEVAGAAAVTRRMPPVARTLEGVRLSDRQRSRVAVHLHMRHGATVTTQGSRTKGCDASSGTWESCVVWR
jgi:hypothetical protein